jgi:guanylate kinase
MIARRGICLVVVAPSGAGKTSLTRALLAEDHGLTLSVSCTTRAPREGEQDGVHYHFIDEARFAGMVSGGALLEHAQVYGRSYGTPRAPVEAALAAGRDVLFDIDWQGFRQVRAALPADTVGVFILPPTMEELERRLRSRAQDNAAEIGLRLAKAREEIGRAPEYDHVIVNARFDDALADLRAILRAERCRRTRLTGLADFMATLD